MSDEKKRAMSRPRWWNAGCSSGRHAPPRPPLPRSRLCCPAQRSARSGAVGLGAAQYGGGVAARAAAPRNCAGAGAV